MLGLYLHIPFCSSICNYCNFNRGLYDEALERRYVAALRKEIERAPKGLAADPACAEATAGPPKHRAKADTVFFGGGTPSLLTSDEVAQLIDACRQSFDLSSDAEITLETNPETVDRAALERFRAAGVNRISFGVQSFDDRELKRLGRIHSAARAEAAVRAAREAGLDNLSLDLMMWLPGQTVARWLENVHALIAAAPDHASLYLLELYPNAPLKDEMARAGLSLAPDEDAAQMYLGAMDLLDRAGFVQYEISNVARPGRESRHNLKYWTDGEWLGFGCGAHSTYGGVRWRNLSSTEEYAARIESDGDPRIERRVMDPETQLEEALFTGLRLNSGVDLAGIGARYNCDVWSRYGRDLQPFVDEGWLVRDGARLRLTRPGMLMANEVMAVFV